VGKYYFGCEGELVHSFVDLLALLEFDFLIYLVLPVDVLLVEALDLHLIDALLGFELEVGTESALLGLDVLVSLAAVLEQFFSSISERLVLRDSISTSS
jgi:hypothetical protein